MLVLSRKKGESIMIGGGIEVTILDIDAETIKVGINAPKDVEIYRKELYAAIRESNVQSTQHALLPDEMTKSLLKLKKNNK